MCTYFDILAEMNDEYQHLFFDDLKNRPNQVKEVMQATLDAMRIFDPDLYKALHQKFSQAEPTSDVGDSRLASW